MPQCVRAAAAPLASLLFLLAAAATAEACVHYTHERSIVADLPFSSFRIATNTDGTITAGEGDPPSNALLVCARHAAAFNVSAASVDVFPTASVCTIYSVAPDACPRFEQRDISTAATAISACNPAAVAAVAAAATSVPAAMARTVFGAVSGQRFPAAAAVGGVLRGRVHARTDQECLDLCARWVALCDTVTVDTLTRSDAGVVVCSLHAAARAQALPSPGFHMYVGVAPATAAELAAAPAAAPAAAGGNASTAAAAPAPAPAPALGNLGDALDAVTASGPTSADDSLPV